MKPTFTLLTALLLAPLAAIHAANATVAHRAPAANLRHVAGATHVIVNKPAPGRAFGWPANGGIWNWGNEILVMYLDCPYQDHPGFSNHDSDQEHPSAQWMTSRSTDGGVTWTEHRVAFPDPRANRKTLKPQTLTTPIDFRAPDTLVNFHWDSLQPGARTYFYYSTDRGRIWQGPFDNIPLFDFKAMTGRTDYEVTDKHSMRGYMSCTEVSDDACLRESSYAITTDDGGVTWRKGSRISRELPPCGKGHKIEYGSMPSTVRVDSNTLVSAFRSGYTPAKGRRTGWIDIARSADNGATWRVVNGYLMEMPTLNSSPPALSRLPSGRLVCSWGWRLPDDGSGPTAIQARTSDDDGTTWGDTLTLRQDGFDYDIGYCRQAVRPDGKVVTVYYYRTKADAQSPTYIAATIWDAALAQPPAAEQARFHVSAAGDDTNPGTESKPFATIQKAINTAQPGDLIYVRATGGPFFLERRVVVNNKSGEPGQPIRLFAYPGEAPVFDGSRIPTAGNDVMRMNNASWWHLRGLTFVHGPEAGLFLYGDCHDNLIERCTTAHNGRLSEYEGSGFVFWGPTFTNMARNHLLNCDAHHNANLKGPKPYSHGDGFKLNVGGPGNRMTGCRAWHNGDDGNDFFYATRPIELRQCWAAKNGEDDAQGTMSGKPGGKLGDGNGFKLGGDNSKGETGGHTLIQCVAWGNPGTGFDENRGRKGVALDQCTAWANGHHNFGFWDGGTPRHVFRNNIAAGPTPHNSATGDNHNNTWSLVITDPMFASTDDTAALGPRAEDGGLPKSDFLHLLPSSPCHGTGIGGVNLGAFPVARPVKK